MFWLKIILFQYSSTKNRAILVRTIQRPSDYFLQGRIDRLVGEVADSVVDVSEAPVLGKLTVEGEGCREALCSHRQDDAYEAVPYVIDIVGIIVLPLILSSFEDDLVVHV